MSHPPLTPTDSCWGWRCFRIPSAAAPFFGFGVCERWRAWHQRAVSMSPALVGLASTVSPGAASAFARGVRSPEPNYRRSHGGIEQSR